MGSFGAEDPGHRKGAGAGGRGAGVHGGGELYGQGVDGVDAGVPVRVGILLFDATGEREFLEVGRLRTVEAMAGHVSAVGVHDHGFNNVSTYGNLWRLMGEGRIGWDYVPNGSKIPRGESSMWGDYHARELGLYLQRIIENKPYYAFFGPHLPTPGPSR